MILNKVAAHKSSSQTDRALSLLMEDMAVWYPAPYYDVEAMLIEETKGSKSSRKSKARASIASAKRSKVKKPSVAFNSAAIYA